MAAIFRDEAFEGEMSRTHFICRGCKHKVRITASAVDPHYLCLNWDLKKEAEYFIVLEDLPSPSV